VFGVAVTVLGGYGIPYGALSLLAFASALLLFLDTWPSRPARR